MVTTQSRQHLHIAIPKSNHRKHLDSVKVVSQFSWHETQPTLLERVVVILLQILLEKWCQQDLLDLSDTGVCPYCEGKASSLSATEEWQYVWTMSQVLPPSMASGNRLYTHYGRLTRHVGMLWARWSWTSLTIYTQWTLPVICKEASSVIYLSLLQNQTTRAFTLYEPVLFLA